MKNQWRSCEWVSREPPEHKPSVWRDFFSRLAKALALCVYVYVIWALMGPTLNILFWDYIYEDFIRDIVSIES